MKNYPSGFTREEIIGLHQLTGTEHSIEDLCKMTEEELLNIEMPDAMILPWGTRNRMRTKHRIEEIIDTLEQNTYKGLQDTTRELIEELLTLYTE